MKVKEFMIAGVLAAVLLGACNTEQPVTDPVQTPGITQGLENEEKGELTSTPGVTSEPEESKEPEATAKPETTVAPAEARSYEILNAFLRP